MIDYSKRQMTCPTNIEGPIAKSTCFLIWSFKLLMPDFLVMRPNLFDNVGYILKEPRFKALRVVFFIWFFFTVMIVTSGYVFLKDGGPAYADHPSNYEIQTHWHVFNKSKIAIENTAQYTENALGTLSQDIFEYTNLVTEDTTDSQYILIEIFASFIVVTGIGLFVFALFELWKTHRNDLPQNQKKKSRTHTASSRQKRTRRRVVLRG